MSQYFPKPYERYCENVDVELDLYKEQQMLIHLIRLDLLD